MINDGVKRAWRRVIDFQCIKCDKNFPIRRWRHMVKKETLL